MQYCFAALLRYGCLSGLVLLGLAGLGPAGIASVSEPPALDTLIKNLEKHYNQARTLSVSFVEQYSIQGRPRKSEAGVLTLRKPGRMRWDYTQPPGKLFVSDGKSVYLYLPNGNRVERSKLKDSEDMRAPLAFLLGRLDMRKEFAGFTTRNGPQVGQTWLEATAKSERLPYEKVEMLIDSNYAIRRLIVTGRDTSALDYTFQDEKVNPPVNEAQFQFQIPPGAEVTESTGPRSALRDNTPHAEMTGGSACPTLEAPQNPPLTLRARFEANFDATEYRVTGKDTSHVVGLGSRHRFGSCRSACRILEG